MSDKTKRTRTFWMACSAITLLLLGSSAAPTAVANHIDARVQVLDYDFSIPFPNDPLFPFDQPACDEDGITQVLFCAALEEDFDRVAIQIWDTGNPTPIPVGAQYTFTDEQGNLLWQDVMCGHKNTFVPQGADQLLVELAHPESWQDDRHQFGVCGAAPFDGQVRLRWLHSGGGGGPGEPGQECPDCECQCDCHPILGCTCECEQTAGEAALPEHGASTCRDKHAHAEHARTWHA